MFTGIIEGLGSIVSVRSAGMGKRLTIDADFDLAGTKIGDSLAINGACLTAVTLAARRFQADVAPETIQRTTFQNVSVGDRVNIERALLLTDRLDGHLVSGHVDGVGTILDRRPAGNATLISIGVSESLGPYIIEKGSIAVDGISLTVNQCSQGRFEVSIIPHTGSWTTIAHIKVGEQVNIETDMIGKYVERFVSRPDSPRRGSQPSEGGIDAAFLAKSGFI